MREYTSDKSYKEQGMKNSQSLYAPIKQGSLWIFIYETDKNYIILYSLHGSEQCVIFQYTKFTKN